MINTHNLTKTFSDKKGIYDINLQIQPGEIVCILGKSGCGKSTLLRTLAGIEKPDKGTFQITEDKKISYVSQEYTLWPHLTVIENLTLVPITQGKKRDAVYQEANNLLNRFELRDHINKYPHELSGGQRQRVALLRAIMNKPDILLLDEVTSALDPELVKGVLDLIRALAKDGYTMVIVTHHMSFAMSLADTIIFLKEGTILENCSNAKFFMSQENPEIRSFIMDIARKDDTVEIFKGREQFQAYHMGLMRRLPEFTTIYVAGAVGDAWYSPMGEFYKHYEELRIKKHIAWKMVTYNQGEIDRRLVKDFPELNQFRSMPRNIQSPANYNVFGDTVITQIFENEPTIIQIKNQSTADAYLRFFEELWNTAT